MPSVEYLFLCCSKACIGEDLIEESMPTFFVLGGSEPIEYVDFGGFVVSNVAFGGDDLDHLYVTGSGHVWKLPLSELAKEPPEPTPNEEHWSRAYKEEV